MTNGNEAAYPFPHIDEMKGPILDQLAESRGLTKREWLAGMAMQGFISCDQEARVAMGKTADATGLEVAQAIARMAVTQAEWVIKELNKPQGESKSEK